MRLYSAEWVAAFNEAVAGVSPDPGTRLRMLQVIHDAPEPGGGTVRVALEVADDGVRLVLDPPDEPAPDVTVSVAWDDATALSRGEVDPAGLLAAGRVRVRGNLSALVAGQSLLTRTASRLEPFSGRAAARGPR